MADMGMGAMGGMNMPAESMPSPTKKDDMAGMEGMSPSTADNAPAKSPAASATTPTEIDTGGIAAEHGGSSGPKGAFPPGSAPLEHSRDTHGAGNSTVPKNLSNRLADPGSGFEANERRVLTYADLASVEMQSDERDPARTIELHITGNMDRYMWSFDGKKYSEARNPIPFRRGERLRMILVNDTMMEHPIHLHGMWMELENGAGMNQPLKHTISVKPAERLSVAITPVEAGRWALHCHLLLHMEMGMFRVVEVTGTGTEGL
jgi:FtsP/CotA-like multicopper oxidase with cupredoxin domain